MIVYCTILCLTILNYAVQYRSTLYYTALDCAIQYCIILRCSIISYYIISCCTLLSSIIPFYIILHHIALYFLHYITLYYIILSSPGADPESWSCILLLVGGWSLSQFLVLDPGPGPGLHSWMQVLGPSPGSWFHPNPDSCSLTPVPPNRPEPTSDGKELKLQRKTNTANRKDPH